MHLYLYTRYGLRPLWGKFINAERVFLILISVFFFLFCGKLSICSWVVSLFFVIIIVMCVIIDSVYNNSGYITDGTASYVGYVFKYFCHRCSLSELSLWHICGI